MNGDAARLAQVFRNLISNAVKFTDEGGRIAVTSRARGRRIRVTVTDSGVGMTEAQQRRLFQPFITKDSGVTRRGLGLGLVISQAIVAAHDGRLEVTSPGGGRGTTACVELATIAAPAKPENARVAAAGAPAEVAPLRPARVLLVEDDVDSAQMFALLFSSAGFDVQVAGSVYAALQLADSCEVLVSDVALPDGSGLDLMWTLRARRPTRAIALSGYGGAQDVQRSLAAGFRQHLTKPVDLDQLIAAVRRLVDEPPA